MKFTKVYRNGAAVNVQKVKPTDVLMQPLPDTENAYSPLPDGTWELTPKTDQEVKLEGIEFEGVMCSATAEDQWGLASIREHVLNGLKTNFKFSNGAVITLTPDNMLQLEAVWIPFRASFF